MARLIDADALKNRLYKPFNWNGSPEEVQEQSDFQYFNVMIDAAPTIDAVPVVRCRECKHARPLAQDGYVACILWSRASNIDGFCHMGARMDGGLP